MDSNEPKIRPEDILVLQDDQFQNDNVCIVAGAGTEIGRATAIAAAANNLMTVGFDANEDEGKKTQRLARETGGQMIFIRTDLQKDEEVEYAVMEAAKLGTIKYLANIAGIQHCDAVENFPMKEYDQMQRIMLRAPFYLSQLTISHMKKSADGTGVIGNTAVILGCKCIGSQPVNNITEFGLRALSQSISAEGAGKIRSFAVSRNPVKSPPAFNQKSVQDKQQIIGPQEVVCDVPSRIKAMISPITVANLFIFGFSRFARYLICGELLFDSGAGLV
jgi:3-hydroxybutyrate dehydrogenase